jgi:signal transduction histidine kinase
LTLVDRLTQRLFPWPADFGSTAGDAEAFRAQCDARLDEHARIVWWTALLLTAAFWPSDLVTLGRLPEARPMFVEWRLWTIGCSAFYLVLPRVPLVRRNIMVALTLTIGVTLFFDARAISSRGGPGMPFLQLCFAMPLVTIPLPLRVVPRAAMTLFAGGAMLAGIFLSAEHRASPYALEICAQYSASMCVSVALGHVLLMLLRQNFVQARELARRASALSVGNEQLEQRVAARTRELCDLLACVETAQEAERARVARELHDALGQELLALRYALSYTRSRYAEEPEAIAPNLDELEDLLERTSTTTRELVAELRPRILDDLGFVAAARWLVSRVAERSGLECEVRVMDGGAGIDAERSTAAFRILQEALTNVVKHASARRVDVSIDLRHGAVDLCVADDGVGVGAAAAGGVRPPSTRLGLLTMRERAGSLSGSLSVGARAAGGGTEVRCVLPLAGAAGGA